MKIKKDGHLVEPLDPDVDAKSQKIPKKKQKGSEEPSRKRPRSESDPKDLNEGNLPSAVETSGRERGSQMTTVLSNIIEHHGRKNQRLASLEQDLAHTKLEEEKLKATIEALEKEKSKMNARVALMERKDLYDLLEAKMEGFQIANHPGMIGGHRTLQDEVDRTGIDACYQSLLHALKAATGTLPNSLAVFEYMRNIFDSYVNPSDNPNVQPLVKGLDADDFSMDKFFGLQDPTSPDDVQASPDFEDLRTNQRLRLQAEVRNLGAEPQRVTRSTRVCLDYEPTILPYVPPTDNPTRPVTLDLTVDARKRSIFPTTILDCAGSNISGSHSVCVVPGE
ncbi:hypothetical protein R1flu_001061 [Riccia fluitans]|uniref:Uncharacterized protein n=1 Tax=Riccia fluitans TaxID=41844 RepID=A0ABD1Y274_9MARC